VSGGNPPGQESLRELADSLKHVLEKYGKPYVVIAGADLAHIGAQFGDRYSLDGRVLQRSKAKDEEMLQKVQQLDKDQFIATIRSERDSRRICGVAPIYFQLMLLEGSRCEVVSYDQWSDGASSVSFAGAVFYR
jgi:AmmeMemoRadiSam system protein B